jgi:hypothetical protein
VKAITANHIITFALYVHRHQEGPTSNFCIPAKERRELSEFISPTSPLPQTQKVVIAFGLFVGQKKNEFSDVFRYGMILSSLFEGQTPFPRMYDQTAIPYRRMNFKTLPFREFDQTPPALVSLTFPCWSSFQSLNSRPKFSEMWDHFRPILAKGTFPDEAKRYLETIKAHF